MTLDQFAEKNTTKPLWVAPDPLAKFAEMFIHLLPFQPAKQVDEISVLKQYLIAPMAGEHSPGTENLRTFQQRRVVVPLEIAQGDE